MFRMKPHTLLPRVFGALIALALLLTACNVPTAVPTPMANLPTPTSVPANPTAAPTSAATQVEQPTAAAPTQTAAPAQSGLSVTVDVNGVAQSASSEVVPAAAGTDASGYDAMPQYTRLNLNGYPITNSLRQPQIFVFPVKDLGVNQNAAKNAVDLQTLLQTQQPGDQLPYLPLAFSSKQALHPQVKFLDFKSGKGARYLTEWHNGLSPIDNQGLIYTFQGLTSDGKYYVAAVLPVNLQGLPANPNDTSRLPTDFPNNYTQYLADTISLIEQNPDSAFTPDLSKLDALVQSIEVK